MELTKYQKRIIEGIRSTHLKRRLHKDDVAELDSLARLAIELNEKFSFYPGTILINPIQTDALWGLCEPDTGVVHILFRWPREDYRIERRTIVRVLCHELAHFLVLGHSAQFFETANSIIDHARELTGDPKIKYERFISSEYSTCGF